MYNDLDIEFHKVRMKTHNKDKGAVPVIKKTHITKLFVSFLYYNHGDTEVHKIKMTFNTV